MKVVDFHVHVGRREDWHPWVNEFMEGVNPRLFQNFDEIMSPDGLMSYLRSEGVDKAVVLAEDCPITTGVVSNDYVARFCSDRDMFVPFASIHPWDSKDPVGELMRCVNELGFKGLKLYPTYQHYFPNQKEIYPIYEKAQELGIPVMVHTGSSVFKGARIKYGEPKFLDDVAVDFPDLDIVMAHSGRGAWYEEAFLMATIHKNVYMEISGLPPKNIMKYFPNLEKVIDKVIFGSDWPGVDSIGANIKAVKGLGLYESSLEKVLGANAMKILEY